MRASHPGKSGAAIATATCTRAACSSLASPPSLVAIALLLANDHLLKARSPSWLTGKLSDFAGLYFAPYLAVLAAFAALWACQRVASRGREPALPLAAARALGGAAFAATGALFAALKLSPVTARPAQMLLETLAGHPLAMAMDPTDLPALAVLPLAHLGWRRQLARQGSRPLVSWQRAARVLLVALAALSALASYDAPPMPCAKLKVAGIAADPHQPGTLWATRIEDNACTGWQGYGSEPRYSLHRTGDGGRSWTDSGPGGARVLPDPLRPGLLYLSRHDSLWLYQAGGGHLTRVWPPPGQEPTPNLARYELGLPAAAPPWRDGLLYVGLRGAVGRSEDGGQTWAVLHLPGAPEEPLSALAAAPSQPGLVLAAQGPRLWQSSDWGESWRELGSLPGPALVVAVDPAHPERLLASSGAGLARSDDGGRTWRTAWSVPASAGPVAGIAFDPEDGRTVYAAVRQVGLLASRDGGESWATRLAGDVRDVAVTRRPAHRAFATIAFESRGFGGVSWGGVYRQRGPLRLPFQDEWEPADRGLGNVPRRSGGRFAELFWWAGVAGIAAVVGGLVFSPRFRQWVRGHPWEAAHRLLSLGASLLLLCAIVSGQRDEALMAAIYGAYLASFGLALLLIPARLDRTTWGLTALPLVLITVVTALANTPRSGGLPLVLASYDAVVLAVTLVVSAVLRERHPRVSKVFLVVGIVGVCGWWLVFVVR